MVGCCRRKDDDGLFSTRLFADCHDRAVRLLAMFLENERLHVVLLKRVMRGRRSRSTG